MTVKRLLSIDGGGIRGIIAAEILVQMEVALKRPLCEYFDFISGTSTGSIIAAGLAKGMSASEILEIYKNQGKRIFSPAEHTIEELLDTFGIEKGWGKRFTITNLIRASGKKDEILKQLLTQYTGKQLEEELQRVLGEITLGSPHLKTNLMIVTNNVTRGQNWFFVNNTVKGEYKNKSKYLDLTANIPLWKIVRSSSAAPTFFPPFSFKVKVPKNHSFQEFTEQECEFIDGGVGPYNNSSFQLFLQAVHPKYGTAWDSGVDKLLLVSIGTGYGYADMDFGEAKKKNNAQWAGYIADDLMLEANRQQNQLMKLISMQKFLESSNQLENGNGFKIVPRSEELLTYCRFTSSFTVEQFKKLTQGGYLQLKDENGKAIQADAIKKELVDKLEKMDCVDQIENLSAIGQATAKQQFDISLFKGFL